jgi:hypothetical protein
MKDYLISMYIDNELDLDNKIEFVRTVCTEKRIAQQALELLEQEKMFHTPVADPVPATEIRPLRRRISWLWRPAGILAPALAAAALLFFFLMPAEQVPRQKDYRFVVYQPEVSQVEISGSFNDWQRQPMKPAGTSGYWEVTLPLAGGEHSYTFIIDDDRRIPDPTLPTREQDDFGGQNSILNLEA